MTRYDCCHHCEPHTAPNGHPDPCHADYCDTGKQPLPQLTLGVPMRTTLAAITIAALLTGTAHAQPTDRNQYPDLCGNERNTDCTRVILHERSNTHMRVHRNRNQGGMSIVLYPGLSTQELAGMTDWGSIRVPKRTVAKIREVHYWPDGTVEKVRDYRWKWTKANQGKRNLPNPGRVDVYVKTWKPR